MSISASPLIPGQDLNDPQTWKRTAGEVLSAVAEALPQIPSAQPLTPDAPVADPGTVTLPDPVGAAITGYLGAGVEGKILLVVGADLVEALKDKDVGVSTAAAAALQAIDPEAAARAGVR